MFSSYAMAEKENVNPRASKKRKMLLFLGNKSRFCNVSQDEVQHLEKEQVPKATATSTQWAFKILNDWVSDYNDQNAAEEWPECVLTLSCNKEDFKKMGH